MVKEFVGHSATFFGRVAILMSAVMLVTTIIIPFIAESFQEERGITAMAIMDSGGISLGYYGYSMSLFIVLLSLGILSASLGEYVTRKY